MEEAFLRTEMLLGRPAMEKLSHSHVAVLGLGGVGSWCAEALARSSVGTLTLVDCDQVSPSNLNRQLVATLETLGRPKAEAMAERVSRVAPNCKAIPLNLRYTPEDRETFFAENYDFIVDAIDTVSCKLDLIQTALSRNIPILSALGTGNKLDPSRFQITDISKTQGCPLARVVRKELRSRGVFHHRVLWSNEEPLAPQDSGEAPPPGRRSIPGSVPWVPSCAGLMLAGDVVLTLIQNEKNKPE
ncbi:MAG: tRNA threonylcarbamoyladenosine dehydratase [Oscillospiraceae bacterium]|jgi:tRNA A37 threonylcarbamoyladenosine dehydratase|nr:tRNA threonylcarbamoyladenosine dehydratase [Oscillospiraceae bacterium]